MLLSVRHVTHYAFSQPVAHGLQRLRLTPKTTHGQDVREWTMALSGAVLEAEYEDHNHNRTTLISVLPGTTELVVTCTGMVETADNAGVIGLHAGHMPLWAFETQTALTRPGPRLRALAAALAPLKGEVLNLCHELSRSVLAAVAYEIGHTSVTTTAEEALVAGHGVCQDHAHIFISAARLLGVPARYVSGYLMMDDRIEQEAGHAWAEAHVPGLGWVGFDVSNGICPDARYVRVATGRDYGDAAPVTGLCYGPGESVLAVKLAVEQQTAGQ
ncbi:MAG: hypothetical protein RIQ46_1518 [Pseudomonadota bacterium]|jgi:transglutaminase-like putative cysteine protease